MQYDHLKTAPMRWSDKDPSWNAKGIPCSCCGRDLKPGMPRFWVHVINGGGLVLHPESEAAYTENSGEMGYHPVGPECARKLGKGFAIPSTELDKLAGDR